VSVTNRLTSFIAPLLDPSDGQMRQSLDAYCRLGS
jgi:hypothetical protein